MKRGFYNILAAQFLSSLADNALLIAAMSADGVSRIDNIEQIDRGYENIEQRLTSLGANIKRCEA